MRAHWTPRALRALAKIHEHIATDNPAAADQMRDRVLTFVETKLVAHPMIGRTGRVDGTRESVIHPSYILVYRPTGETVEIVTVRHVAREWPDRF